MKSPKDMRIIQIDITNACLYQCSNCTRFCGHHKKNFFMDFETFQRAVNSMRGYHGTIGVMGGEPTLHPEFERFVKYLHSQLPPGYKKEEPGMVAPQRDFIESVLLENKRNSEVYEYSTGLRETVTGAGLWSAMVPTYKKHYELIQDVFKMQAVNDHGNIMYHSPILINRKDLNIPDDEWIKIRDHCWAQDIWSATITPKGAFFCEIAGALDMLFDGPGGWPIEEGWWKRTPDQFGDQLRWCELCGIAIETFTRDANDWVDDVSESMYRRLEEIGSPKLKKPGRINRVKIENGRISEESKHGSREVRKALFYDSFLSRFNQEKSVLFPEGMALAADLAPVKTAEEISGWLERCLKIFDQITLIVHSQELAGELREQYAGEKFRIIEADGVWGHSFAAAVKGCPPMCPIIYMSGPFDLRAEEIHALRSTVINPGTLHITDLGKGHCDFLASEEPEGVIALFHGAALSLRRAGFDFLTNASSFASIESIWDPRKKIPFMCSMVEDTSRLRIQPHTRYAVYGAGATGRSAMEQIRECQSEIVLLADSDRKKWGSCVDGVLVVSPEEMAVRKGEYDLVIIASVYFQEIRETLQELGFTKDQYTIFE